MFIASIGLIGASNIQTRKQEMNVESINQNCLKVEGKITGVVKVLYTSKIVLKVGTGGLKGTANRLYICLI